MIDFSFWGRGLPQNGGLKNTFLQVITSGVFCYNQNEIWQLTDVSADKWTPLNSVGRQSKWFYDFMTDTNPNGDTDFLDAIIELETYIGAPNITGFSFHVPWYWNTQNDTFLPLNAVLPVIFDGNSILKFYKKGIGEGAVRYNSGGSPTLTNRFWACPGNHDCGQGLPTLAQQQQSFQRYQDYMPIPNNPSGTQPNKRYYSAVIGIVEFFFCNWSFPYDHLEPDGISMFKNVVFNADEIPLYYSGTYGDGATTWTTPYEDATRKNVGRLDWNTATYSGMYIGIDPALNSEMSSTFNFEFYSDAARNYTITVKKSTASWAYTLSAVMGWQSVSIPWSSFVAVAPTAGAVQHPLTSFNIDGPGGVGFFKIDDIAFGVAALNTQAQWLKDALAASTATWKVVIGHNPPYSSGEVGPTAQVRWRFKDWGADVVISGDEHSYERLVVDGLPYIVQGCGGAPLNDIWGAIDPNSQFRYLNLNDPLGNPTALPHQNAIGYGAHKVTVTETSMTFLFYNRQGTLIDTYVINKAGVAVTTATFALIGDFGVDWSPNRDVSTMVRQWNPAYVISVGDNCYMNWLYKDAALTQPTTGDDEVGKYYNQFIYPYRGNYTSGLMNAANQRLVDNLYTGITIGGVPIETAQTVPLINGQPYYGGTPDDLQLKTAIQAVINRGYKFIFYSFMEVVDPPANSKPWRGNLLPGGGGPSGVNPLYVPTVLEVQAFMDKIKAQHLFYANYLVANGLKPYAFVLTSEMVSLNQHKNYHALGQYTDGGGTFDFTAVAKWKEIYTAVKAIFTAAGWPDVLVGYSPDWSEYHGYTNSDGAYIRHLDELYMHQDMVFMDAYFGITESKATDADYNAFKAGWTNGRNYDYYVTNYNLWKAYAGGTAPITLPEFAQKNLKWWMENAHEHVGPPPGYVRTPTPWVPNSRKIFFNEVGCSPLDSGGTEPNLVFDAGVQGGIARGASREITITNVGNLATATVVSGTHDAFAGDEIAITGGTTVGYNGKHIITNVISATQFQFLITENTAVQTPPAVFVRNNNMVQYNYLKSLHECIIDGTLPIAGVNIWQCDSRALSLLKSQRGALIWAGDSYRIDFAPWLQYIAYTTIFETIETDLGIPNSLKLAKEIRLKVTSNQRVAGYVELYCDRTLRFTGTLTTSTTGYTVNKFGLPPECRGRMFYMKIYNIGFGSLQVLSAAVSEFAELPPGAV